MMRYLLISCICFVVVFSTHAQENLPTILENVARVKEGPGYNFPTIYQVAPDEPVTPIALSSDEQWVYIEYEQQYGWVEASRISTLPEGLTSLNTTSLTQPELAVENCITLIGDSVPHGEVVYKIEGHAFVILRSKPLSVVLQDDLHQNGLDYLEVRDRSASAAFLSEQGKFPYSDMPEYQALLNDKCRFAIIMPWVNDLSVERTDNVEAHIADLTAFVQNLHARSPETKMLVLGFYYGQRAEFVAVYSPGHTDENISLFNERLFVACEQGLAPNVTCMETASLFAETNYQHVVLGGTQEDILDSLYEPIPEDVLPYFEVFWRDNPDGWIVGDGVHLSTLGKNLLSEALIQQILIIEPDL